MRLHKIAVVVAFALIGAGCLFEFRAPDIVETSANLRKGMENIDPLQLKMILQEAKSYQQLNQQLKDALSRAKEPWTGVLNLTGAELLVEVVGYQGTVVLDGWVDTEGSKFAHNIRYEDKDPAIPYDVAYAYYQEIAAQFGNNYFGVIDAYAKNLQKIDERYKKQFKEYLAQPLVVPTPDVKGPWSIEGRLLKAGVHEIKMRVTPVKPDALGKWSLLYRVTLKRQTEVKLLYTGGFYSTDSGASLGTAMFQNVAKVTVEK